MTSKKLLCFVRFLCCFWGAWPIISFADTTLHLYRPFGGSPNHPTPTVSRTVPGFCREQSHQIKREDAWRCYAEGKEYDPCFVKRFSAHNKALCVSSPWASQAIEIQMKYAVDNQSHLSLDMSRTYPWAVFLDDGTRCLAETTEQVIDGLQVRYKCLDGSLLIGRLQRCKAQWSILQYANNKSAEVAISKAWF